MADKLRSIDIIRDARVLIRKALTDYDFKLDGEFGDAYQLRASWMKSAIPVHVAEFLSEVLNIDKLSFMYHDDNDLEDKSPNCRDNDDHTMKRQSTAVLGWRARVMSLFQILFYNVIRKHPCYTSVSGYRLQQCIYINEKLQCRAVKIGPGVIARYI